MISDCDTKGLTGKESTRAIAADFAPRLGFTADVNENVTAVLQFATGGSNPVSTNQTFGNGFSRKDIGLDLAYLDWAVNDNTHVYGGKMKNPFHRAGSHALIWDSDLNPEGVAVSYSNGGFFSNAGVMFVEERALTDDTLLLGLQGGYRFQVGDGTSFTTGISYFDYTETAGQRPFFIGLPRGNTVDEDGNLVFDYNHLDIFVEMATTLRDIAFLGVRQCRPEHGS